MFSHELNLLVTCLIAISTAIRVDWNTNKGPIVPPTPRTTQRPQLPYRAPAPVWEDQSNDIPNPNPYVYVLPPPSRPRPATNNYLTSDRRPVTQAELNSNPNYGYIVSPYEVNSYFQQSSGQDATNIVAGLAPKYPTSNGYKYAAVVAGSKSNGYFWGANDKFQGKYNAKTKKFKAYEKSKYYNVPPQNYQQQEQQQQSLPNDGPYVPLFDQSALVYTQQLPEFQAPAAFNPKAVTLKQQKAATESPNMPKLATHSKDDAEKSKTWESSNKKKSTDKSSFTFVNANAISGSSKSSWADKKW